MSDSLLYDLGLTSMDGVTANIDLWKQMYQNGDMTVQMGPNGPTVVLSPKGISDTAIIGTIKDQLTGAISPVSTTIYRTAADAAAAVGTGAKAVLDAAGRTIGYVTDGVQGLMTSLLTLALIFGGAYLAMELLTAPAKPKPPGGPRARR